MLNRTQRVHRQEILRLATDFLAVWQDPRTPARERKRMAALLLEDVTVRRGEQVTLHVCFRGGTATTLTVPRPLPAWERPRTSPPVLTTIDALLTDHTDAEVATLLNAQRLTTGAGQVFTGDRVKWLRAARGLTSFRHRLRAAHFLTAKELAYGGTKDVMPTLDALAREAPAFTNAYTQASHSNYADLAPLSSHYPLRSRTIHYPPQSPTYPRVLIYDVLKALGYHTSVFSSQNEHWEGVINYIKTTSVDRFMHGETFDGPTYVMLGDMGLANWVKQTKRAGNVDDRFTVCEAMKWIESLDGEPFSMYLNLQNSHVLYPVPEDFPRRFSPAKLDFTITFGHFPRAEAEVVKGVYADSLAYVDSQIGRLFEFLRTRGLWERTVIVVTGDHGQAFYEHGFASHASELYNEVMRVPLLIRAPGLGSGLDDRPAQHVDVPPSVFELLGLPPHPSFQGISLFGTERHEDRSLYVVCQTPLAHQYAVVRSGFKLLYDERRNSYKLYDLVRDLAEATDLARMRPALAKKLTDRLHAWRRAQIDYYADESRHGREYPPIPAMLAE